MAVDNEAKEWEDFARELVNENDRLKQELARIQVVLINAVDRNPDKTDTAIVLARVASNAIYWRNREIESFKQWLLNETGTVDLEAASAELRTWRDRSRLFHSTYQGTWDPE